MNRAVVRNRAVLADDRRCRRTDMNHDKVLDIRIFTDQHFEHLCSHHDIRPNGNTGLDRHLAVNLSSVVNERGIVKSDKGSNMRHARLRAVIDFLIDGVIISVSPPRLVNCAESTMS